MPTKQRQWLPLSLSFLAFLLLGIFFGTIVKDWPVIKLKPEVDVFAGVCTLVSVLVTLLVAWWVTNVLEKRNSNSKTEKDIIIKHIDIVYDIVEETRNKIRAGKISYTLAASNIKRIYKNSEIVLSKIKNTSINLENDHLDLIQKNTAALRDLLTGNKPNDLDLIITDGFINISEARQTLLDFTLDDLRSEIFTLELAINSG
jgi:hypothetical protein